MFGLSYLFKRLIMPPQTVQLPPELAAVLRSLVIVGGATPMQLEVESGRIGEDISTELERLRELGLVRSKQTTGGYERELYFPSSKGREILK